ncbi:hypothetical protein BDR22DRAFT_878363 [Usnea florida]
MVVASVSDIAIEASDMILLDSSAGMLTGSPIRPRNLCNLKKNKSLFVTSRLFLRVLARADKCALRPTAADVLLRKPRDTTKDRLVEWQLMLQSYGFIGLIECLSSFAMSYWYLQRNGIPFSTLCFGFGAVYPSSSIRPLPQTPDTTSVPAEHFFLPAAFGLGMLLLDEGRK